MPTTTRRPASDKQIALIRRLIAERDLTGTTCADWTDETFAALTTATASRTLDVLFDAPRKPQAAAEAAKPGYYVRGTEADREVLVVVENRTKTGTYAKRLAFTAGRASWEYAPGVGRTLAGLSPLTVEEAARLGHMHGVCVVCARRLTDPESVQRGIGPVCSARLSH